jgi:hypothetical protein
MKNTKASIAVAATLAAVAPACGWRRPATASEVTTQAGDIVFESTLAFRNQSMSIDGAPFSAVPCSKSNAEPAVVGSIALDQGTRARLTCADDYLGGISLSYSDTKGETQTLSLSMDDGDAGEEWDTRSWISAGAGPLRILTVTLSSSTEIDTLRLLDCKVTPKQFTWDSENKTFAESEPAEQFDPHAFTPPIAVAKECLDDRGSWKGK